MKKRYKFLGLLGLLPFLATAQLTNNGATIVIEQGARLVVEGDINNTSGAINSSGVIEVKGDFVNTGTLTSTGTLSDIEFTGDTPQSFNANGATVDNVSMMNTDEDVTLTGPVTVNANLNFADGSQNINIDDQNMMLSAAATVTQTGTAGYIEADGSGRVVKTYGATGAFTFPVGDADDFSPIEVDVTAGTVGSSTVGVNLDAVVHPSLPLDAGNPNRNATEYITRSWDIEQTGMGGTFSADVTGMYADGDVVETDGEALIKPAIFDGTNWTYEDSNNEGTNEIIATIGDSRVITGSNSFGSLDVTVLLQGPFNAGTMKMSTLLNSKGILQAEATTSPYGTGETVSGGTFFASNPTIVDWIKLELRDNTTPATILEERSAFVDEDGNIREVDGTLTTLLFKNAPANAHVAVRHRNHLGARTLLAQDLYDGSADLDFSSGGAFGTDPMAEPSTNVFALYAGNATGLTTTSNQFTRMTGPASINDAARQLNFLGTFTNILNDQYAASDVNMDGVVRMTGPASINDAARLLSFLGAFTTILSEQY